MIHTTLNLIDQASALVQASLISEEPIPIEAMATWEGSAEDKLTALFYVSRRLDTEHAHLLEERDRITERASRIHKDQARVKDLAADLMLEFTKVTGKKKCKTPTLTFSVRSTKAVHIYDEIKLPEVFWTTRPPRPPEPRPDKKLIGEALKHQTVAVPGAELVINHHIKWK